MGIRVPIPDAWDGNTVVTARNKAIRQANVRFICILLISYFIFSFGKKNLLRQLSFSNTLRHVISGEQKNKRCSMDKNHRTVAQKNSPYLLLSIFCNWLPHTE